MRGFDMQLKNILNKKNYSTIEKKEFNNYSTIDLKLNKMPKKEADILMASVNHLIDDPSYKPFFFKVLYKIGRSRFIELALMAEKGKHPSRLFVYLLKEYN